MAIKRTAVVNNTIEDVVENAHKDMWTLATQGEMTELLMLMKLKSLAGEVLKMCAEISMKSSDLAQQNMNEDPHQLQLHAGAKSALSGLAFVFQKLRTVITTIEPKS